MLSYANEAFAVQSGVSSSLSNSFLGGSDAYTKPAPKGEQFSSFIEGTYFQSDALEHTLRYEFYTQDWTTDYYKRNGAHALRLYKIDQADRHTGRYVGSYSTDKNQFKWSGTVEYFVNESRPEPAKHRKAEAQYNNLDVQWDHEWGIQTITQGVKYIKNSLDIFKDGADELPDSNELRSIEYYFQDQLTFANVQLLPGFRFQNDNLFGSKFTPKINARYNMIEADDHTLFFRVGIGEGYRIPNLKELYHVFDHTHLGYVVYGNKELEPESAVNYQVEVALVADGDYAISLNLFKNDLENLIDTRSTSRIEGGAVVSEYYNISKARTSGVEVNGQLPVSNWMTINAGYTYLDAQDLAKKRRLDNRPRHQTKASVDTDITDNLSLLVNGRFYGDQIQHDRDDIAHKTSPYSVIDLKINYSATDYLSLYIGVDNLTDTTKDYLDQHDQRPRDGRFIYTGFTLTY